jgi:hypothetical protein
MNSILFFLLKGEHEMKTKLFNALSLAVIMAMLFTSLALADNINNDITVSVTDTIVQNGNTKVGYKVVGTGGDGQAGCNASDGSSLTLTISFSNKVIASGLSAENKLTFSACNIFQYVTFTSSEAGNYPITVSYSDTGVGSYNNNANFILHVLDVTPPDTSIDSGPSNPSSSDSATFAFSGTDNAGGLGVASYECALDSSIFIACISPRSYNELADGSHTFQVRAIDLANNVDPSPASYTWVIETTPPDTTAPTAAPTHSPTANANGWNNADVTVTWNWTDNTGGSGIDSANCTTSSTSSGEGTIALSATCKDLAGNTGSASYTVMVDKTAPSISATPNPIANGFGWNNTDVTVSYSCTDGGSGVDAAASSLGDDVLSISGTATGTCVDMAGNSANASYTAQIDKVKPVITGSVSPATNANGWNNTDVAVSFSCTDSGGSGIDVNTVAGATLTGEDAGQSVANTGTCTDKAGNTADSVTVSGINIDKTAPSVALVGGPVNGGVYYFGFVPAGPTCSATDALSGLDGTCSVSGYGTGLGSHTVSASATDKAGNSGGTSATYTVLAWTLNGFYQPVDMDKLNTVKGGSTVPFKFEVFAGGTELTDISYIASLQASNVVCATGAVEDAIETVSTGGTSLRYDWTSGQFIFNWQTPKKAGNCYKVTMTTLDGSSLSANFKLK